MQPRTKIAAGAAVASAVALALTIHFSTMDDGEIRGTPPAAAPSPPAIRPITPDPKVVEAGTDARVSEIFSSLEGSGPTATMYLAMRQEFPDRYAEMKETLRKELASGQMKGTPEQRVSELTRESLDGFRDLVRHSSDESLRKVAAAQYALLSALSSEHADVCARYAAEGGYSDMPQDPQTTQAVIGLATVQIHAAGDAARSPKTRQAPTAPIFAQLVQRMRADGITPEQIYLLGDGKLPTLPPVQQCQVAMSMYRSALGLPPADAGILLAAIIKS